MSVACETSQGPASLIGSPPISVSASRLPRLARPPALTGSRSGGSALNVFCQVVRHDIPAERVKELNPKGIIFSGGPMSVYEPNAPKCDPKVFDLGVPVLGICYGMQLAAQALGGTVGGGAHTREYGRATLTVADPNVLFRGYPKESTVWMSHGDQVQSVSGDWVPLAATDTSPIAAVKHRTRPVFCIQFHPEVSHTTHGRLILQNFLRDVHSGASRTSEAAPSAGEPAARLSA